MPSEAERTVAVLLVVDLLSALRALGAASEQLCRAVGLRPSMLRDPGARVPWSALRGILDEAGRLLDDPLVGLHAAEKARPRGTIMYLLLSCPRLEWAVRRWMRFSHLVDDALRFDLHRRAGAARVVIRYVGSGDGNLAQFMDYSMVNVVRAVRATIGNSRGVAVELRHSAPDDIAEFARVVGCPVRFASAEDALVVPARMLAMPSRFANPLVAERIEQLAIALETKAHRPTVHARVSDAVQALLIAGMRADRARVARQLGMSGRTMQRALADEGMTFRDIRDGVVWDGVPGLLANPDCSVEMAAVSTGYADTAGFSKAFKRRMGCSPSQFRERMIR